MHRHKLPISRFFAGLTEQTFQSQLGVVDPPLVDYVSDLLHRFVRHDALIRFRDHRGKPLEHIVDMLVEAEQRVGVAKRELHRHIGDFTLFWAGLYPESLSSSETVLATSRLSDYHEQGKRAYWIASTIETDDEDRPSSMVLERLSHRFELCAYGLREVRREWERRDDDDPQIPLLFGDN